MHVLGEYHAALGELVHGFEGTLERFTGDGLMVFFNDPLPCPDPPERAVRMAVAMRDARRPSWPRAGAGAATTSDFGVGIAQGHATLGRIGFEGRFDYAAIGSVTNLAARLCAEAGAGPDPGQPARPCGDGGHRRGRPVGELALRGFSRPVRAYNVVGLDAARARA